MVGTRQKYREGGREGGSREMKRWRVIKMEGGRYREIEEERKRQCSQKEKKKRQSERTNAQKESL